MQLTQPITPSPDHTSLTSDRDETSTMPVEVDADDAEDLATVLQRIVRAGRDSDAYIAAAVAKGRSMARARVMAARPRRPREWGFTRDDYAPPPRLVGSDVHRGR